MRRLSRVAAAAIEILYFKVKRSGGLKKVRPTPSVLPLAELAVETFVSTGQGCQSSYQGVCRAANLRIGSLAR